jgi:hypothetical protein
VKALGLSPSDTELVLGGNLLWLISKVTSHIRMPLTAPPARRVGAPIRSSGSAEVRDPLIYASRL